MSYHAFGAPEMRAHPAHHLGTTVSLRRRGSHPTLADDLDFIGRAEWGLPGNDPEREVCTWPELIDQRAIGRWGASPFVHDDDEPDDEDHGIEDLPQDAREEDGI